MSDEPFTRGGTDTAPSPLGIFAASLGMCVMNQFNRLAITVELDLIYTRSSLSTVFSGEEGADFKEFTQPSKRDALTSHTVFQSVFKSDSFEINPSRTAPRGLVSK